MKNRDKKNYNFTKFGESDEDDEKEVELKPKTKVPKSERNLNKQHKNEFLEDNDYSDINTQRFASCSPEIKDYDISTHDAWVVQCPKGMDLSALLNKRVKLPGRRYVSDIQVRSTNYEAPFSQSVGYVNIKGKYALRQLPLMGHMMVSRRINIVEQLSSDEETKVVAEASGSQKVMLPVRHPFFGRHYQSRVEVDRQITRKLRRADQRSAEMHCRWSSPGSFYKIRQELMASTKTPKEKMRKLALTGVSPSYVNLSKEKETADKQAKMRKKAEDPTKSQSTHESDAFEPKQKKKRKRQIISDNDEDSKQDEYVLTKSEPNKAIDVEIQKLKKKKKRSTQTATNIDLTLDPEVPPNESNDGVNIVVAKSESTDDANDTKTIIKKKKKKRL